METLSTSVIVVNHEFQDPSRILMVDTPSNASILTLKRKTEEMLPGLLSSFVLPSIFVWKMKSIKKGITGGCLLEILENIDINDTGTIVEIYDNHKVADLALSDKETLLLQLPGT